MPTAPKKSSAKAPAKPSLASKATTHPSWIDMIKECIIAHPEDARGGFVESKYKVELNASSASQLNRAITSGSERGTFVLPKGPSGKVKLTPKVRGEAAKENSKPVSKAKAPAVSKTTVAKTKPAAAKATKPKPKGKTATSRAASSTKPAPKKAPPPKKALAGKTNKTKATPAKKTTAPSKRAPAKKVGSLTAPQNILSMCNPQAVVGKKPTGAKKPAASADKPKSKPTASKAKPKSATTKAKPASKAPSSKAAGTKKPASKKATATPAAPTKET
ncbi:hypothetical protein B0H17DRAFT_1058038 [Mycena rosella]|uniref:Histone H1 n=1 Tax=Mycena rosella TaxID=1033263 RepID=A0AAD7DKY2_MYCRO|nr:hypothetical protein B0H17DRAFT_1058038 [Mycena rosella]